MVNGVHYINGPTTKRPKAATSDALNCLRQEAAGDRDKNTLICSGPSLKVCLALSFLNNEKERKSLAWNCRRDGERSFAQSLKRKSQSINNRADSCCCNRCQIVQLFSIRLQSVRKTPLKIICSFWGLHGLIYEMWHDFESVETPVDSIRLLLRPH